MRLSKIVLIKGKACNDIMAKLDKKQEKRRGGRAPIGASKFRVGADGAWARQISILARKAGTGAKGANRRGRRVI